MPRIWAAFAGMKPWAMPRMKKYCFFGVQPSRRARAGTGAKSRRSESSIGSICLIRAVAESVFFLFRREGRLMGRVLILLPLLAASCAPAAGVGRFPASEAAQLRLRDTQDQTAMRRHAWRVLADVTRPGRGGAPAWLGWGGLARTHRPARPHPRRSRP